MLLGTLMSQGTSAPNPDCPPVHTGLGHGLRSQWRPHGLHADLVIGFVSDVYRAWYRTRLDHVRIKGGNLAIPSQEVQAPGGGIPSGDSSPCQHHLLGFPKQSPHQILSDDQGFILSTI